MWWVNKARFIILFFAILNILPFHFCWAVELVKDDDLLDFANLSYQLASDNSVSSGIDNSGSNIDSDDKVNETLFWWNEAIFQAKQDKLHAANKILRTYESLADKAAVGNKDAVDLLPRALQDITEYMRNADPIIWKDRANIYALLEYILYGGEDYIFTDLYKGKKLTAIPEQVVEGINAYVHRDRDTFVEDFAKWPLFWHTPRSFSALVDINKADYYSSKEPEKARILLDQIRLMASGSAFEKKAINREVILAAKLSDIDLLYSLKRAYILHFRKSKDWTVFLLRYVAALGAIKTTITIETMEKLMADLPAAIQNFAYLQSSRERLIAGDLLSAKKLALKAIAIEDINNYSNSRSLLYYAAGLLSNSEMVQQSLRILSHIDETKLTEKDKKVKSAIYSIIDSILNAKTAPTPARDNLQGLKSKAEDHKDKKYTTDSSISVAQLNKENLSVEEFLKSSRQKLKDFDKSMQRIHLDANK